MTIKYDDTTNPHYTYDNIQVSFEGTENINPSTEVVITRFGIEWRHSKSH